MPAADIDIGMDGSSPRGLHYVLAAMAAVIIVACASEPAYEPPVELADDATITAGVEAALAESDEERAREINVSTREGVVQLSGFVDSANEKFMVEHVARGVAGVQDVVNELEPRLNPGD